MLNRKQEQRSSASGRRQVAGVVIFVVAMMMLSGTVTVQAQKMPGAFSPGQWFGSINPHHHTAYYLPYYDRDRALWDFFIPCFCPGCRGRYYSGGYWYPSTFRWSRYDVPNYRWWTFGEGFVDEYGTGGIWTAGDPTMTAELKAIQTVERERVAARMRNAAPRMTGRRGMGSTGISTSRGSSTSSSGRGSSIGSSGGGSSIGSSGGGGGRSGKK